MSFLAYDPTITEWDLYYWFTEAKPYPKELIKDESYIADYAKEEIQGMVWIWPLESSDLKYKSVTSLIKKLWILWHKVGHSKTMKGVKEMMELIIEHSKNTKREIMLQPELSAKLIHGH